MFGKILAGVIGGIALAIVGSVLCGLVLGLTSLVLPFIVIWIGTMIAAARTSRTARAWRGLLIACGSSVLLLPIASFVFSVHQIAGGNALLAFAGAYFGTLFFYIGTLLGVVLLIVGFAVGRDRHIIAPLENGTRSLATGTDRWGGEAPPDKYVSAKSSERDVTDSGQVIASTPSPTERPFSDFRMTRSDAPRGHGRAVAWVVAIVLVIGAFFWLDPHWRTSGLFAARPPEVGPSQEVFCEVVRNSIRAYKKASRVGSNDVAMSQLRYQRKKALGSIMGSGEIAGWIGVVSNIRTDRDGTGRLSVQLPCGGEVRSSGPLEISNAGIAQGTNVYASLASLKEGIKVVFDGQFEIEGNSSNDYIDEGSLTERGSMTDPEFIFSFTNLSVAKRPRHAD